MPAGVEGEHPAACGPTGDLRSGRTLSARQVGGRRALGGCGWRKRFHDAGRDREQLDNALTTALGAQRGRLQTSYRPSSPKQQRDRRNRADPSYRGAEIRTRDLTDPNGARYQAAPRPATAPDYRTGASGDPPASRLAQ